VLPVVGRGVIAILRKVEAAGNPPTDNRLSV
jgi:hypothetical protein